MRIAEIYRSLQGEGRWTGAPSAFVRTSGCNLRCWFCDTPYASWKPEGDDLPLDAIIAQVEALFAEPASAETALKGDFPAGKHIVITGGEPLLFGELPPLTRRFRDLGWLITIETAGTLDLPVECDLLSLSPKFASSAPPESAGAWRERHERTRHAPATVAALLARYDYQIKFVIDSPDDCDEAQGWLAEFPQVTADRVWMMPQGTDLPHLGGIAAWLDPYCQSHGFHYCPRRHIEWYGPGRGT